MADKALYMTAAEFRADLALLGLSVDAAAKALHMSRGTLFKYANGDMPVTAQVAMLLRVMLYFKHQPEDIAALAYPVSQSAHFRRS